MSVKQRGSRFIAYKEIYVGTYTTKEEAQAALRDYQQPTVAGVRHVPHEVKQPSRIRRAINVLLGRDRQ